MINQLKFKDSDGCKMFITSDFHLNHNKSFIYYDRGYTSVEEHNNAVISKINEVCRPCDILFFLGDFCLNVTHDQFLGFINRINPRLYFLSGNHNSGWLKEYGKFCIDTFGHEAIGVQWLNKITYFGNYTEIYWNNQFVVLSHFPLLVFNNSKFGSWHLHGHCHGKLSSSLPEAQSGKILDVGWDVFKKPIDFAELKAIMDSKQKKSNDNLH